MSSSISSPKHAGAEPSRLLGDFNVPVPFGFLRSARIIFCGNPAVLFLVLSALWYGFAPSQAPSDRFDPGITGAAADSCRTKLADLEDFTSRADSPKSHTTKFSQDEVNSYLASELNAKANYCLRRFIMTFEEGHVRGHAEVDFDRLAADSTGLLPRLFSSLLSGIHSLTFRGQLVADNQEVRFQLEEANLDDIALPKSLVEEIVTSVGQSQTPPFDPLKPTPMPYDIKRVEVHSAYVVVYQ